MNLLEDKIESFWQWFVQNNTLIKNCIEQDDAPNKELIIEQLNNHILNMATLTWDVGLDDDNEWFFMLSPNGVEELLPISEKIIQEAPHFLGWKFYATRPAKDWDRMVRLYDQEMDVVTLDASDWHYAMYTAEKDKIELVLEAPNTQHLDEDIAYLAATIFLNNEIGEKLAMQHIESYSIVTAFTQEEAEEKYSITALKEDLLSMDDLSS